MKSVYDIVSQYVPFVRKKPVLDRGKALKACPVRHPQVRFERNEEGEVTLYLPRRRDRVGRALMWIFRATPEKEIVLDEVGSDVWELCDGVNSVDAIVGAVSRKYKITRRECETSIGAYLKTLGERNLVGLRVAADRSDGCADKQSADGRRDRRKKQ